MFAVSALSSPPQLQPQFTHVAAQLGARLGHILPQVGAERGHILLQAAALDFKPRLEPLRRGVDCSSCLSHPAAFDDDGIVVKTSSSESLIGSAAWALP